MTEVVERRIFLWCLERDLRATEHLGNLLWLPEKPRFEDLRVAWQEHNPAALFEAEEGVGLEDEDAYFGGWDYHRQPAGGI